MKPEMILVPMTSILEKVISKEKINYPRLNIFEKIAPSPKE